MYILGSHMFTVCLHVHIGIPYVYSIFTCTYWDPICLQYVYMYILASHMFTVCLHYILRSHMFTVCLHVHIGIPYVYSMFTCTYGIHGIFWLSPTMLPAGGRQHRRCIIPQTVTHSLVLLKMSKIISRNMLSWLQLLISRYCCIQLVVYIIYINDARSSK